MPKGVVGSITHGVSAYNNKGCRCATCRIEVVLYRRRYRKRLLRAARKVERRSGRK